MKDRTCSWDDCEAPWVSRGLCGHHYGKAYRAGTLESFKRPGAPTLSNVDIEAKTGDCSVHGTRIRLRLRTRPSGTVTVSCGNCARGKRTRKPRARKGHSRIWYEYGISGEEASIRMQAQGGLCLLCGEPMQVPMIDHCHKTGEVRGILCGRCNAGLGFFRDNPEALMRASKYVRRYLRAAA